VRTEGENPFHLLPHLIKLMKMFIPFIYSLGIDVDSRKLVCAFLGVDKEQVSKVIASRAFQNDLKGFEQLKQWLKAKMKLPGIQLRITLEASGVYHESLCYDLYDHGYQLSVVLPNKAKHYLKALGLRSKNDKIDARGLAQMGAEQKLEQWRPFSAQMRELRSMLRYRVSKQDMLTQISNEYHAIKHSKFKPKYIIQEMQATIKRLKREMQKLDKKIEELLAKDPELDRKVRMIAESVTGLGLVSVATVVAETDGFVLFKSEKQLTSYAGYDVVENSSGKRVGKTKISKQGNSRIRRTLHMPSLNVVRYKAGNFPNIFNRILHRTGIKMKAYVAVQRKLLCLIYTLWKKMYPLSQIIIRVYKKPIIN